MIAKFLTCEIICQVEKDKAEQNDRKSIAAKEPLQSLPPSGEHKGSAGINGVKVGKL